MSSLLPSPWLRVLQPRDQPHCRLICFPHSGGGTHAYAAWPELVGEHTEIIALNAPGRNDRLGEPALTDLAVLAKRTAEALKDSGVLVLPCAFFGHSFGAVVAFEVAAELQRQGCPGPLHIFASAHAAPSLCTRRPASTNLADLSDVAFVEKVSEWGFMPREVLEDPAMRAAVLPALRADLHMYSTYRGSTAVLRCSISALGGTSDTVAVEELSPWCLHGKVGPCGDVVLLEGGHFFLEDESGRAAVVEHISDRVFNALQRLPRSIVRGPPHTHETCAKHTLCELLERNAVQHPDALALVDEARGDTSYAAVWDLVVRLAAQIAPLVTEPGATVGMMLPHSADYVIGMFAIWRAGACFLVLESHHPPEMLLSVCSTCDPRGSGKPDAIVTDSAHAARLPALLTALPRVVLDSGWDSRFPQPSAPLPPPKLSQRAILMTTSGTSGVPKLVECSHACYTIGMQSRWLQLQYKGAAFTQDADREACGVMFVWEAPRSLVAGHACVVIPDRTLVDASELIDFLIHHRATRVLTTPSLAAAVLDVLEVQTQKTVLLQRHLGVWVWMGEVVPAPLARRVLKAAPLLLAVNCYSTWEGLDTALYPITPGSLAPHQQIVPVGLLHPGVTAAVLDPNTLVPTPYGVPGELYTTGPQLSNGYATSAELTAERFVKVPGLLPEGVSEGAVWYKSGDAAVLLPSGIVELQGRRDSTVKIRGFKVGLPFVETAVHEVEGVGVALVVPALDQATQQPESLVCVVGPRDGSDVSFDELVSRIRSTLMRKIPKWAQPTFYLPLEKALPPEVLRQGGESKKINRKAVGKLYAATLKREARSAAPAAAARAPQRRRTRAPTAVLAEEVWAELLDLDIDAIDDNASFFELGGHSLMASRLTQKLSDRLQTKITVLDLYEHASLSALCKFIEARCGTGETPSLLPVVRRRTSVGEPIAVIGMAGRFPGAASVDDLWRLLRTGGVAVTRFDTDLLAQKGVPSNAIEHPDFVRAAYAIKDADKFDAKFWGIGRTEASMMDPQHRLFVETAWHAVEDAGYAPRRFESQDTRVGVWAAAGIDGYMIHHLKGEPLSDPMDPGSIFMAEVGSEKDYIATRVSYLMGLRGPSMNVNSACSSGLVAVAQACQAIALGECDMAVAGASSVSFPNLGWLHQEGLVHSRDGLVRPLDSEASGTAFGDSVGAVVLKRLSDAERDGDNIWGVVKGFGVSNDGSQKAGYSAPAASGQADAIGKAVDMSGLETSDIGYVEMHATGTLVGDGIETKGLREAWEARSEGSTSAPWCAVGSIKGNIGHANCAAGITGLIKSLLMLKHRSLVPTANFESLNKKCDLTGSPFYTTPEVPIPWPAPASGKRAAGVSSFGIGGTNCHLVVQEAPETAPNPAGGESVDSTHQVLCVSAKSAASLQAAVQVLADRLEVGDILVTDAAHTLAEAREEFPLRRAVAVDASCGPSFAAQRLRAAAAELSESTPAPAARDASVVFLFPGQGSQYLGMARGLYESLPTFRLSVDRCAEGFGAVDPGVDFRRLLFSADAAAAEVLLHPTVLQPSLFAVEYALAELLISLGVEPSAAAGHSLGEYAAAAAAGLLPLEQALRAVTTRAKATAELSAEGGMLSVGLSGAEVGEAIAASAHADELWVSALNSPSHTVVSGSLAGIAALKATLSAAGVKAQDVAVNRAFHSPLVADAAKQLESLSFTAADDVDARWPCASTATGTWLSPADASSGDYWSRQMSSAVRWRDCAALLLKQHKPRVCIEVGPGRTLSALTAKTAAAAGVTNCTFEQGIRHAKDDGISDMQTFASLLGRLWQHGVHVNWAAWRAEVGVAPRRARLPGYCFEKASHWKNPGASLYVDGAARKVEKQAAAPDDSAVLVRFCPNPSARVVVYCLPFAGGSSRAFEQWRSQSAAVEFVAVELPGRGGRADERVPGGSRSDAELLRSVADAIVRDAAGRTVALCGLSMGGNLCMELSALLPSQQLAGIVIAGRAAPRVEVPELDTSDSGLDRFVLVPDSVRASPAFESFLLPLLRADLMMDGRSEARLSASRPQAVVPMAVMCATDDRVAPLAAAAQWSGFAAEAPEVRFYPGGHEFLTAMPEQLAGDCSRVVTGWMTKRLLSELALLQGTTPAPPTPARPAPITAAPTYSVRWDSLPAVPAVEKQPMPMVLTAPLPEWSDDVTSALSDGRLVVDLRPGAGDVKDAAGVTGEAEAWCLTEWVQKLIESGRSAAGRVALLLRPDAGSSMVAGASKAVPHEMPELQFCRVYADGQPSAADVLAAVTAHREETDLLYSSEGMKAQRLHLTDLPPPSASPFSPDLSYVVTGATGGLGKALLEWMVRECGVPPSNIVAVTRRPVPPPCEGVVVAAVGDISDPAALLACEALRGLKKVGGLLHLAGLLRDAPVSGQTRAALREVAAPKAGGLCALLQAAEELRWGAPWLVAYSSTSSMFGYAGQLNYCAANGFVDGLAAWAGYSPDAVKRIVSVSWGPWAEAGMAKVGTKAHQAALKDGDRPLGSAAALAALARALRQTAADSRTSQYVVCDVDWSKSPWAGLPILRSLPSSAAPKGAEGPRQVSRDEPLADVISRWLAEAVDDSWSRAADMDVASLGLDSLDTVQLRNRFQKEFWQVPLALFSRPNLTLRALRDSLVGSSSQ